MVETTGCRDDSTPKGSTRPCSVGFLRDCGGGGAALAEELGVDLMAQIPLLPAMGRGADDGYPVVMAAPGSDAAIAFDALAAAGIEKRPRVRTNPALVIK